MVDTARHGFTKWAAGFTQSDVLLNELLDKLEVKLGLSVLDRNATTPPGGDTAGDCYIMPSGTLTGAWSAFSEHDVAYYDGTTWTAYTPIAGWLAWVEDEATGLMFNGTTWASVIGASEFLDNVFRIQDNADATKEVAFEVSAITTGTTRTITVPDANVDLGDIADIAANTTNIAAPIHTLHVETVADQDYVLTYDAPYAGTITTLRAKTESGTCTVTGYINGVALGGTACSAATTADEEAHASANAYAKGDEIKVTVTSNSAATDLEVTFYGTRSDL